MTCSLEYLFLAVKYVEKVFDLFGKHVPLGTDEAGLFESASAIVREFAKDAPSRSNDTIHAPSQVERKPPTDE